MNIEPYSAIMVASYGGPNQPDDVLPFMRNATRGKGIPDERLLEVSEHYMLFGGKSPINELNAKLVDALQAELHRRGADVPVVIGNRNWEPYMTDVVRELVDGGHERVLAVATSAYQSYSNCRQYHEDLVQASDEQPIVVDKLDPFWWAPEFASVNARRVVAAWRALRERIGDGKARLVFVTHSIPVAMEERSGPGAPSPLYQAQHLQVAQRVAELAADELGEALSWDLAFCSRSGPPHVPWLEPDVNDHLEAIVDEVDGVVVAPIGFIADHMEVAFDLDTEAARTARSLGLAYERAGTVGVDDEFVGMLVDHIEDAARRASEGKPVADYCQFAGGTCCPPPQRPTRTGAPS